MMRRWVAALCCATALGLNACGGGNAGSGSDGDSTGLDEASSYFMTDLQGRQYRVAYGRTGPLRATAAGIDYSADFTVDVTIQGYLGASGSVNPAWGRGTLGFQGPIWVWGLDIAGVRKPYVVATNLVTQLSELEGVSFRVLGSRTDADGQALDAYAGSARFQGGVLQLCLPDTPTPFDRCPGERLTSFNATISGSEIQLVSSAVGTLRLRAAHSSDGPILIASSRNALTGGGEFWIGLPDVKSTSFGDALLSESTFESANGQSTAVIAGVGNDSNGNPRLNPSDASIPHAAFQQLATTGTLGICGLTASLVATAQPGMFEGTLSGDWLPGAMANGQWVQTRNCFAGPILHARTSGVAVSLGARGGALMGRWVIVTR
jgi:hypothetical protein